MGDITGSAAPKGRRMAAGLVDLVLIPIVLGLIIGLLLLAVPEGLRNAILVVVNIGWLVFRDAVYSPGRAMVGLKITSLTGGKITIIQALLRNLLLIIPFVLVVGYIVELIAVLAKGERLGDGWAKTRIVTA